MSLSVRGLRGPSCTDKDRAATAGGLASWRCQHTFPCRLHVELLASVVRRGHPALAGWPAESGVGSTRSSSIGRVLAICCRRSVGRCSFDRSRRCFVGGRHAPGSYRITLDGVRTSAQGRLLLSSPGILFPSQAPAAISAYNRLHIWNVVSDNPKSCNEAEALDESFCPRTFLGKSADFLPYGPLKAEVLWRLARSKPEIYGRVRPDQP